MKHYVIAKFKDGVDWKALAPQVKALFEEMLDIPGIHGVEMKENCVDRANRYHLMIIIDMDRSALPVYDACEPHLRWKADYDHLLAGKAIFDAED